MENKEEYVAIRLSKVKTKYVPSTRYLLWCNDKWFETTREPLFTFPLSELDTIKKQLANHYIYKVAIVYTNGNEEMWDFFHKEKKQETKSKGLTFKIKM